MAGLKKKKREPSGNPNVVLIVFLVFFVLLTIGLGVWVYTGHEQIEKSRRDRVAAEKALASEKAALAFQTMVSSELRLATGFKGLDDEGKAIDFSTLTQDELAALKTDRDDFASPTGKFKDEKTADSVRKLLKVMRTKLGVDANGNPSTQLYKELEDAQAKAKDMEGQRNAAIKQKASAEALSDKYSKNFERTFKEALAKIDEGNAKAFNAAREQSEEFKKLAESNRTLAKEKDEAKDEMEKLKDDHASALKLLNRKINVLEAEAKNLAGAGPGPGGGGGPAPGGPKVSFEPLLLNCSTGKPLWDTPVGKVTRVDLTMRQVYINVGSAHGAKPELTFNIFGANAQGRAENRLKGSIEIVKVLDANTSVARITSLYDIEGQEILMNLQTRGRVLRESEAPIREGDLLFNLFWGTRVAIAGYVSITGEPSNNPADQMRQMEDLIFLMKRNGIQVDAYVDFRDGQIKGSISNKTRYLIVGDPGPAPDAEKPVAPKIDEGAKGDKKEMDKIPVMEKEPAKAGGGNLDRNNQIYASSLTLYKEARERGLLMISAENFATVVGYRRARSANSVEASNFRPSLPVAGPIEGGLQPVPPREEIRKEKEMDR